MNDLPSSIVAQQAHARPVTGEELEVFGKIAAASYTNGSFKNLNEAVVESIKKAGLSPEQVKRVVEFANTNAFMQAFSKEGQSHRVVEFDGGPANFSEILKDLNDGGGGSIYDSGSGDYSLPPPDVAKLSSANQDAMGLESAKLAAAFKVEEVALPYSNPYQDVMEVKDKLASVYEQLGSELNSLEGQFTNVADYMYQSIKQASLSGVPLGDVVSAWSALEKSPEFVKAAFQYLTPRLINDCVFFSRSTLSDSLMKTASVGSVNINHPIVRGFEEFCDVITKLAEHRAAQEDIAKNLDQITFFLKSSAKASENVGAAIGKGMNAAGKAWHGTTAATRAAGEGIERGLARTGHPLAGKIVGKAVKYAPHMGAAALGSEAYHKAKYNPVVGAVQNFVMRQIPYTHQNMVYEYANQR